MGLKSGAERALLVSKAASTLSNIDRATVTKKKVDSRNSKKSNCYLLPP